MASAKEIEQYLKRFSQLDAKRFAVVKVGGAVLRDDLDALTSSLAFLQQVGLTPIVVHGAGPQLDEELAAAGIEKQTVDGLRVTIAGSAGDRAPRVPAAEPEAGRGAAGRAARARPRSCPACSRPSTSIATRYGLVGEVTRVDTRADRGRACKAGSIPVIASLGETAGGQIVNINADFAANELVQVLQPYKIMFLTGTGGLLDGDGRVIDSINLSTEYDELMAQPWLQSAACGSRSSRSRTCSTSCR